MIRAGRAAAIAAARAVAASRAAALSPAAASVAAAVVAAAFVAAPAAPEAKPIEAGTADRGSWELVWRYDEANGVRTALPELGTAAPPCPVRWRVFRDTRGDRLQFFDDLGFPMRSIPLGRRDRALGTDDRSAWIVLTPDSTDVGGRRIRCFRGPGDAPAWQAFAPGEPALYTSDGDLLVLATPVDQYDRFARLVDDGSGRMDFVGGVEGETRGELPIFPTFIRETPDGKHVAILRERELFLVGTDGRIRWKRDVPTDNLISRGGLSHLAVGQDLVAVCGTGDQPDPRGFFESLHPLRQEHVVVFDLAGRTLWRIERDRRDELRFHFSCAASRDGSVLATLHATERDEVVTIYEARSGVVIAEHRARRPSGAEMLSISPRGEMTCLAFGDQSTSVVAWDRRGAPFWEGIIPFRSQIAVAAGAGFLAAEHWVVRLVPEP